MINIALSYDDGATWRFLLTLDQSKNVIPAPRQYCHEFPDELGDGRKRTERQCSRRLACRNGTRRQSA